jgi:hypothetical protein
MVSRYIGFFCLKNLLVLPVEKVNPILGGEEDFPNLVPNEYPLSWIVPAPVKFFMNLKTS